VTTSHPWGEASPVTRTRGRLAMHVFRILCPLMTALAVRASAQWSNKVSKDEMTGKRQAFAHSPLTSPTRTLGFPYGDLKAWLGFGCDGESEWAYVGFSSELNLLNTETHEGYSTLHTRVKWDDQLETMAFTQKWGGSFLNFEDGESTIAHMTTAGTALLELEWYSLGSVYFRFSLHGSPAAIARARAACKI